MHDVNRNLAIHITRLLSYFPAVAIVGARQTGKTTLAKQICLDWSYWDLENPQHFDRVAQDPLFFFQQYSNHIIMDEAQVYPELFNVLRGVIDANRKQKGRFILTGSSNPELHHHLSETLAGRVATVRLGTFKINEFYQKPLSPFYQLFTQPIQAVNLITGKAPFTTTQVEQLCLKGGYPEPLLQAEDFFYAQWMENYHNNYLNRDIARLFPRLNPLAYRRFLTMLGQLSGTIINRSDLARAIEVSEKTIREYLEIAEGTFLWRNIPSFEKNVMKAVVKMPKGYFCDNGLLHYLLKITTSDSFYNHPKVGTSFEGFVIEELCRGLEALGLTGWQPYYYRTRNGAEIDLILEGSFGLLPIEIKYTSTVYQKQLVTLRQFVDEHALPLGLVINQADSVEWLAPKIAQVPVGWL